MYVLYRKSYKESSKFELQKICVNDDIESFFGYYDKSPISYNGKYILYHSSVRNTKNKPNPAFPIEVVVQNNTTNEMVLRVPSSAYNWQQGCRTQWLTNELFIFNDFDMLRKKYISRVWSVSSLKEKKVFDYPVQDSYHTDYFLSLNYQRLLALRPDYGYPNLPPLSKNLLKTIDNDGIWKIDYATGYEKLLISLSVICAFERNQNMDLAIHKVNHIMISPSGEQFLFLHRYYKNNIKHDRLLLADSITGELKLLNEGMVSHCFWLNDRVILGYMQGLNKKSAYWFIDIETGKFSSVVHKKLDNYCDGHPHVYGDWFITDTYPDKARMQHLILVNWKTGNVKELGEYFHGFKYSGEARCDLHPRFSSDGKSIFFDSVFSGKRHLYKLDII
jgi:hypothetical protein